jgi:ATP/maltotriose-dependent transcriptional regulator MalT
VLGCVALSRQGYAEAQDLLQQSAATLDETGERIYLSEALANLGLTAIGLGDLDRAERHLCQAMQFAVQTRATYPLLFALPAVALLRVRRGQSERAIELYALASRYPVVANSRWFEDVAGRHITAAAAALPPDVVAAARERGRARDLWATAKDLLDELTSPEVQQGAHAL